MAGRAAHLDAVRRPGNNAEYLMLDTLNVDAGDIIAVVALVLAVATFVIHLRDRAPRITLAVGTADAQYPEGDGPDMAILWIDVINSSPHRVKANSIWIEFGRRRWPTYRWRRHFSPELHVAEPSATYSTER